MTAYGLKTEYMRNPVGLDIRRPRFTWLCRDGMRQTAWEIRAFRGGEELWTSGKREGSGMSAVLDAALRSRDLVTWQIRVWDENGVPGDWSEPASFEMGLLEPEDFQAAWTDPELEREPGTETEAAPADHRPASYLRRTFSVEGNFARARLYITCHGLYEAWINGKRAGDAVLTPGCSSYDKRIHVQTIDVTDLLRQGENEALVILGDGWYRSCSGVDGDRNLYGTDTALWFQLEADGKPVCLSDASWEATQNGPIRMDDMQQGEVVDARLWPLTGWHGVTVRDYGTDMLRASNCVPVKEHERFPGRLLITPNGEKVLDFGQNLAGYVEFTLRAHAGDTLTLTHGETLDENGNFTQENFQDRKRHKEGGTRQQVVYTCREGLNTYRTKFSIWGFRYAKLETDLDLTGTDARFTAVAVYSDMERTGWFECGSADVNRLVENTLWSMKSNFCDVPTDCPTRERAAWTGDMGVFAETGLYLMDCVPVVRKWMGECRLCQYPDGKVANIAPKNNRPTFTTELLAGSVGWGDASILVPWAIFRRTGDPRILEENLEMMRRWYGYLETRAGKRPDAAPDLSAVPVQYRQMLQNLPPQALAEMMKKFAPPQAQNGAETEDNPYQAFAIETGTDYGEWCEPDVDSIGAMGKPQAKVATAYYAYSGRLLSEICSALGDTESAARYAETARGAAGAFRHMAAPGGEIDSDRQAEYVRAIHFDLLSPEEKKRAAEALNDLVIRCGYHLNTGFLSTPDLCPVLAENGHPETAYRVLLQDTMPGWLYEVRHGATTIWEEWDGVNERGEVKASLNHYSKGTVCGWLFSGVCGIRVEEDAVTISPRPSPLLGHAKARYLSPVGEIVSGWSYREDGSVQYTFRIPANTCASVSLPDGRKFTLDPGEHTV